MKIGAIRIKNFRSHRDTKVVLFPLTVLVGHGSSGKSNFFEAIVNLSMVLRGKVGDAFSVYPWTTFAAAKSWSATPTAPISFEVTVHPRTFGEPCFNYEFSYKQVGFSQEPIFEIGSEKLRKGTETIFDRNDPPANMANIANSLTGDQSLLSILRREKHPDPELLELARGISRVGKYRLEPGLLSRPSHIPPPTEEGQQGAAMWLDYKGENLATVLYQLNETERPKMDAITEAVRLVFPDFDGFKFNFIGEGRVGFSVRLRHRPHDPILAPLLSHGMLLFIGLMTLLHTPTSPDVILLEEPENGLDAKAIRTFYQKLVEVVVGSNNTGRQVLLSSHSPYVLSEAWNGTSREFIYHVTEHDGQSKVSPVTSVMETFGGVLQSDGTMSIRLAERIMSERWQTAGTAG